MKPNLNSVIFQKIVSRRRALFQVLVSPRSIISLAGSMVLLLVYLFPAVAVSIADGDVDDMSGDAADDPHVAECPESIGGSEQILASTNHENGTEINSGLLITYKIACSSLFQEDGNSQFRAGVETAIEPYLGRVVSKEQLKAIQDEITLLYLQGGYVTSRVDYLTLQEDGTLYVYVIEGFISQVHVGSAPEAFSETVSDIERLGAGSSERSSEALEFEPEVPFYAPPINPFLDRYIQSYLNPAVSQRPVNFFELEERLRVLSNDSRFEPGSFNARLRLPEDSLSTTHIHIQAIQNLLNNPSAALTPAETQELQNKLSNLTQSFEQAETPGASHLEITVKINEAIDLEDVTTIEAQVATETAELEAQQAEQLATYIGAQLRENIDPRLIRFALHSLEVQEPGLHPAIVFIAAEGDRVFIQAETSQGPTINIESITQYEVEEPAEEDYLEAREGNMASPPTQEEEFQQNDSSGALQRGNRVNKADLVLEVEAFWRTVQNTSSDAYRQSADQLYDLLIRPLEVEFEERGFEVNTLVFVMGKDLGILPTAALYDSQTDKFLAEKYRISIIPNVGSLDMRPSDLSEANLLAMGSSEFRNPALYPPLSAVPLELELIDQIWRRGNPQRSTSLRNQEFTLDKLRSARLNHSPQIMHLATHATFRPGKAGDSSIQLWDSTLPLNPLQLATLNFDNPPLELLVLSACQTALGDEEATLGFAGSFLQADVRAVVASLWVVNDLASLIYMMEFYRNLASGVSKGEAVQNVQLAMLDEQRLEQNFIELELLIINLLNNDRYLESLSEAEKQRLERLLEEIRRDLFPGEVNITERYTHPFYWSSYTLVGSPW
jgi:CHAT domain-containing protein